MDREKQLRTALIRAHIALRKARSMAKDIPHAVLRNLCADAAAEAKLALDSNEPPKDYPLNTKCECGHSLSVHRDLGKPGAGECLHRRAIGKSGRWESTCKKKCNIFRPAKKGKK